ncbi:MAG: glycosyltransferase family 4 protein [Prolixibacteraceae bacterium]|nr:glycosyltransferase family 4 protein [Prolixibacteraceae bacterium]
MNIIQIIPGSGGSFYCGNCLRDSKYFNALRSEGHQVIKIPMYLPLFADEHDITTDIPVFYGAVSIYLKQLYPIFRKAPKWFDKILNSKPLLKLAASMAGSTNAKGLEEMTESMLLGEEGKQREELERMVDWIAEHCKPDIIHISNALLLGLAHQIKEKVKVPVVCSLQDEDVWVDAMEPVFQKQIWILMHEKSKDVDAFISVSNFFADIMKEKMSLPDEKVHSIYLGVDYEDYTYINAAEKPRNVGYLSRMNHENGFDIVVNAFIELKKNPEFGDVNLVVTGGSTGDDTKYIRELKKRIKRNRLEPHVEFYPEFEGEGRHDFFKKVSVVSVPVRNGEAFGMYLLESMASGVPVVQPALGAFPEIIEKSKGGIIYKKNTPEDLAKAWSDLLNNKKQLAELSRQAVSGVKENFDIRIQSGNIIRLYKSLLNN